MAARAQQQPSPTRDLAVRLVEELAGLTGKLRLESGLYRADLPGSIVLAQGIESRYRSSLSALPDDEAARVRKWLDSFLDHVESPLRKSFGLPEAEIEQHSNEIARSSLELLEVIRAAFDLAQPSRHALRDSHEERAIVVTDLVQYSTQIASLPTEASAGRSQHSRAIKDFDASIRKQIEEAVLDVEPTGQDAQHILLFTGDGAKLSFPRVDHAIQFARALHRIADSTNDSERVPNLYRHRVGIAFGLVLFHCSTTGVDWQITTSGLPFIEAARIEACCPVGGIAIEQKAWTRLLTELPEGASPETNQLLAGFNATRFDSKHDEVYHGWATSPIAPAPRRRKKKA